MGTAEPLFTAFVFYARLGDVTSGLMGTIIFLIILVVVTIFLFFPRRRESLKHSFRKIKGKRYSKNDWMVVVGLVGTLVLGWLLAPYVLLLFGHTYQVYSDRVVIKPRLTAFQPVTEVPTQNIKSLKTVCYIRREKHGRHGVGWPRLYCQSQLETAVGNKYSYYLFDRFRKNQADNLNQSLVETFNLTCTVNPLEVDEAGESSVCVLPAQ